jgi:hypothetical protein
MQAEIEGVKKMKQGRERDIEIAKLKGLSGQKHPIKVKNWSTNRNDAWELWDELRNEFSHCMHYSIESNVDYIEIAGMDTIKGKDFADCVSQAWIKWKESK